MSVPHRPVILTIDEARVLKDLANLEKIPPGALVRRLIAQEAARHGLLLSVDPQSLGETENKGAHE